MKSRRSFDFFAPYNEEGERVVTVPFPVAVRREVTEDHVAHDANPLIITVSPGAEAAVDVDVKVQPGSLLIVRNTGGATATVAGQECPGGKTTTLMYDGDGYILIGGVPEAGGGEIGT